MKTFFLFFLVFLISIAAVIAAGEGTYGNETYGNFSYGVSSSSSASSSENIITTANANTVVNATAGASAPNITLDINTSTSTSGTVTIVKYTSQPSSVGTNTFSSPLNRYIDIVVDNSISNNLNNATIKMFYTDEEVSSVNLQESTLRLSRWNGTDWVVIDSPDGGVDTINNFVFAKTSQFSTWGLFGTTNPSPTPSSSGGGVGGGGGGGTGLTSLGTSIQIYMREGVGYSVYYLDADNKYTYHTLSVRDINQIDKTAVLVFESKQKEININPNSFIYMNFDEDNYYDIKAKIKEFVSDDQIRVEIVPIHEEIPPTSGGDQGPVIIPEQPEEPEVNITEPETNLTEPIFEEQPTVPEKEPISIVVWIASALLVSLLIGFYLYQRFKKKKDEK